MRPTLRSLGGLVDAGVVAPALGARGWVEGQDPVEGRTGVERSVHQDGRELEGAGRLIGGSRLRDVSGVGHPRDFELADVLRRDLVQRHIAHAARIVPVVGPVALGGLGRAERQRREQDPGDCISGRTGAGPVEVGIHAESRLVKWVTGRIRRHRQHLPVGMIIDVRLVRHGQSLCAGYPVANCQK